MKRYTPLIVAALLLAFGALSQTTYLGNILQMHRQVEPLPTATNYEGAILYNRDAGALYFSNGTAWAPIASTSGGTGDGYWIDAGLQPSLDGGMAGFYAFPTDLQVRIGAAQPNAINAYTNNTGVGANPLMDPIRNPAMLIYTEVFDAGDGVWNGPWTTLTLHTRHTGTVTRQQFIQNTASVTGSNLYLFSDRRDAGDNYAQIVFQAANGSAGTAGTHSSSITEYNYSGAIGGDGAFARGLNIHSQNYLTFSAGANSSSLPSFFIAPNGQLAMGYGNVRASTSLTLDQQGLGTALWISGSTGTGIGFANNGTDMDLGSGVNDYIESNGTRVEVGDGLGGLDVANLRVVGNTNATTTVTSTTTGNGGVGFNQAAGRHYMMATNKEARPILSGPDWVYDGRSWDVEVQFEQTACPVLRKTLLSSAGTDVTTSCSDDTAATATTGAGFPARAYRNFIANGSAGDRSIFVSGTAPASGVGAALTSFVQRGAGPITRFWMRVNEDWSTNVLWYGGLMSAVPTVGEPATSANSVYVRFNRATDSTFVLCATGGSARTCTSASASPANGSEYLIVIDCSEVSTSCYLYINGAYQAAVSSNLPAVSNWMGFGAAIEFVSTSSRSFGLGRVRVTQE